MGDGRSREKKVILYDILLKCSVCTEIMNYVNWETDIAIGKNMVRHYVKIADFFFSAFHSKGNSHSAENWILLKIWAMDGNHLIILNLWSIQLCGVLLHLWKLLLHCGLLKIPFIAVVSYVPSSGRCHGFLLFESNYVFNRLAPENPGCYEKIRKLVASCQNIWHLWEFKIFA